MQTSAIRMIALAQNGLPNAMKQAAGVVQKVRTGTVEKMLLRNGIDHSPHTVHKRIVLPINYHYLTVYHDDRKEEHYD